jgi:hypothetical protein
VRCRQAKPAGHNAIPERHRSVSQSLPVGQGWRLHFRKNEGDPKMNLNMGYVIGRRANHWPTWLVTLAELTLVLALLLTRD